MALIPCEALLRLSQTQTIDSFNSSNYYMRLGAFYILILQMREGGRESGRNSLKVHPGFKRCSWDSNSGSQASECSLRFLAKSCLAKGLHISTLVSKFFQLVPFLPRQTHTHTHMFTDGGRKLTLIPTHIQPAHDLCGVTILESSWWVLPL